MLRARRTLEKPVVDGRQVGQDKVHYVRIGPAVSRCVRALLSPRRLCFCGMIFVIVASLLLLYAWALELSIESPPSTLPSSVTTCPRADDAALQRVSAELSRFFNEVPDIHAYPWYLSMVSALRFGANAVYDAKRVYIADHDIDIMLTGPRLDRDKMLKILQRLVQHFRKAGMFVFPILNLPGLRPSVLIFESHPTQTSLKQATEEFPHIVAQVVSVLHLPGFDLLARGVAALLGRLLLPFWSRLSVIDFHYKSWTRPHPNRTVLWAGQRWPFPEDVDELLVKPFSKYVGIAEEVKTLCDFRLPRFLWPQDTISNSPSRDYILDTCIEDLHSRGYFSFNFCTSQQGSVESSSPSSVKRRFGPDMLVLENYGIRRQQDSSTATDKSRADTAAIPQSPSLFT